jgi:hypothetical protein
MVGLLDLIDKYEGGGSYNTLYGHSQRPGRAFDGTDITNMTLSEVMSFAAPSGTYGQWVKDQVGRVATPMGRYQIVGTTLRNAVAEMGLDPNQKFDAATQDAIAAHLAEKRVAAARTPEQLRAGLRNEWEGLKNVPDKTLDAAALGLPTSALGPTQLPPDALGVTGLLSGPPAPNVPNPMAGQYDPLTGNVRSNDQGTGLRPGSAYDVFGGVADLATATNGDTIRRDPTTGQITRTSAKYGWTENAGRAGAPTGGGAGLGALGDLMPGLGTVAGAVGGGLLGGPGGAMMGMAAAKLISSLMEKKDEKTDKNPQSGGILGTLANFAKDKVTSRMGGTGGGGLLGLFGGGNSSGGTSYQSRMSYSDNGTPMPPDRPSGYGYGGGGSGFGSRGDFATGG